MKWPFRKKAPTAPPHVDAMPMWLAEDICLKICDIETHFVMGDELQVGRHIDGVLYAVKYVIVPNYPYEGMAAKRFEDIRNRVAANHQQIREDQLQIQKDQCEFRESLKGHAAPLIGCAEHE